MCKMCFLAYTIGKSMSQKQRESPRAVPEKMHMYSDVAASLVLPFGKLFARYLFKHTSIGELNQLNKQKDIDILGKQVRFYRDDSAVDIQGHATASESYICINTKFGGWKNTLVHEAFHLYFHEFSRKIEGQLLGLNMQSDRVKMSDSSIKNQQPIIYDHTCYILLQVQIINELLSTLSGLDANFLRTKPMTSSDYLRSFGDTTFLALAETWQQLSQQQINDLSQNILKYCIRVQATLTKIYAAYENDIDTLQHEFQKLAVTLLDNIKSYQIETMALLEVLRRDDTITLAHLNSLFKTDTLSVLPRLTEILAKKSNERVEVEELELSGIREIELAQYYATAK